MRAKGAPPTEYAATKTERNGTEWITQLSFRNERECVLCNLSGGGRG